MKTQAEIKAAICLTEGVTMVNYISALVFVILLLVGGAVVAPLDDNQPSPRRGRWDRLADR